MQSPYEPPKTQAKETQQPISHKEIGRKIGFWLIIAFLAIVVVATIAF